MSIAIPFQRPGQPQRPQAVPSQAAPPDPVFALMAATQMYHEGRLLTSQQDQSGSNAKLNSIPTQAATPLRS